MFTLTLLWQFVLFSISLAPAGFCLVVTQTNTCSNVAADGSRLAKSKIQVRASVLSTRYLY